MAENYGTLEGTLDEHGVLSGEMSDRATLEGEIQFGSGGGGVLDVFQNGQSVVQGRYAYVTVPTFLRELRSDDYHNTVTTLEIQTWNGKADASDIPENITDLSDIAVDNIQNGQVLKWDATQNKFVNANESGGGGDITDVKVDGISVVDPVTGEADIDLSGKADKALDAVAGDFAVLLANGNYANSGKSANDMASKAEMSVNTSGTQTTVQLKNGTSATINNPTITIQKNGQNVDTFTLNQTTNKVIDISVPTKTSDLQNDSSFITNTVNNLANYYLKSQTYTQTEVDALIDAAINGRFQKVNVLPATGEPNVIYLVPKATPETSNACDEYIWQDNAWELIGSTDIDLSGYVTDEELNTALADYLTTSAFNTAIANYYTKTEVGNLLDDKVDKISGKGLSTNDYDNTAKGIVDGVTAALADKVDKETGKGLSTNDYTTNDKNKLAGIAAGATKTASSTTNGNIKINDVETQVYDDSEIQDKIDETTTSISGNPISIPNLKANQLAVNPIITLEPIQAGSGTPSPSNIRAISGYDKIEVLSCGKNIWVDGDVSVSNVAYVKVYLSHPIPAGTYKVSAILSNNVTSDARVSFRRSDDTGIKSTDVIYNASGRSISDDVEIGETAYIVYFYYTSPGVSGSRTWSNIMIAPSSTDQTYEPPVKTTDLSESLGQTVYWGRLNVRTGEFEVLGTIYDLGDLNYVYTSGIFLTTSISSLKKSGADSLYTASCYEYVSNGGLGIEDYKIADSSTSSYAGALIIHDSRYTDAPTFKTAIAGQKIVYKLATPFTIQLTPHEISLLKDYAYVSTNGTNIALDYHNGELASLSDVAQVGETVNTIASRFQAPDYANAKVIINDEVPANTTSTTYTMTQNGYIVIAEILAQPSTPVSVATNYPYFQFWINNIKLFSTQSFIDYNARTGGICFPVSMGDEIKWLSENRKLNKLTIYFFPCKNQ